MRFGEFVLEHELVVAPVERFAGLIVEVGMSPGWEPFDSAAGTHLWICRSDPRADEFCANAVLTMHAVKALLDPAQVFAMLVEQQMESVPNCRELGRALTASTEGPGAAGVLTIEIDDPLGTIGSVSRSRIITSGEETLIAQLTVTTLAASPVDRARVWLTVRAGPAHGVLSAARHRGEAPVDGRRDIP